MNKISGGSIAIGVLALTVWVGVYLIYQRWVKKRPWKQTVEFSLLWGLLGMGIVIMTLGFMAAALGLFVNPPPPPPIAWPPYGASEGVIILGVLWTIAFFILSISGAIVRAQGKPNEFSYQDARSLPTFVSGAWNVGVFQGGITLAAIYLLMRSAAPHLTLEEALLNTFGWIFLIGLMMAASMGFAWAVKRGEALIRGDEAADGEKSDMFERLDKWLGMRQKDSMLSRIAADLALAYSINPESAGFVSADGLLLLPESLRDGLGLREGGEELRFFRSAESERYEIWTAGDIEQLLSDDPATGNAVLRGLSPVIAQGKRTLISRVEENLEILHTLHSEPAGYISRDGLLLVPKSVREGLSISDEYGGGISLIRNRETGRYEVWTTEELDRWFSSEPIAEDEVAQSSDEPSTDDDEIAQLSDEPATDDDEIPF